jgi:hypothetical protein
MIFNLHIGHWILNEILPTRELCELDNTSLVPQHTGKKYLT